MKWRRILFWDLELGIFLELGAWDLEFPARTRRSACRFLCLRQLAAFLRALPAGLRATGKRFDLRMFLRGRGDFVAGARAHLAQRIRILRPALQHLARERRDPGAIARRYD